MLFLTPIATIPLYFAKKQSTKSTPEKTQPITLYKKHKAFVLNLKVVLLSRSPNIKFGIYKEKDKSKIFIFG